MTHVIKPGLIKWLPMISMLLVGLGALLLAYSPAYAEQKKTRSFVEKLVTLDHKPPAPEFALTDIKGETHRLADYQGKILLINFWAVWCVPCRKEMPALQRLWRDLQEQHVVVLAINWGDEEKFVREFLDYVPGLDFPILIGGDMDTLAREWSLAGVPTTFFIDAEGRIVHRLAGECDFDDPVVREKLLSLHTQ